MSSSRNRVMYAGTTVLVSNYPSWSGQTGLYDLKLLSRVQSSSISVTTPVTRTAQIGSAEYAYDTYIKYPQVGVKLNYCITDNSNELVMGLVADGTVGAFHDMLSPARDRNLFFVLSDTDFEEAGYMTNFIGKNVLGVGNAFLTNYSIKASVGSVPTADVSFDCLNLTFQNYNGSEANGSAVPSINLLSGSRATGTYALSSQNFIPSNYLTNQSYKATALRPGDIVMELDQPVFGGIRYSGAVPATINSFEIDVPIERKDLVGFGSNYPYDKKIMFPSLGKVSFNGTFDVPVSGSFENMFNYANKYNLAFNLRRTDGTTGLKIQIKEATVESQSFDLAVGNNMTFQSQFSFKIFDDGGLVLNGSVRNKPGNLLSDDASYQINSRIAGKNPVYAKNVVTVTSGSTIRNKGFWASNVDLTCSCVYNNASFGFGTLISPRHVVFADHNKPPIGSVLYFTRNDDTYATRTLSSYSLVTGSDVGIGLLDSDIPPTGISFAKILPQNWADYLKDSNGSFYDYTLYQIPIFGIDQFQNSYIRRWWDYSTTTGELVTDQPTNGDQLSFYKDLISGDSGGPNFIILNGTAILLGCNYTTTSFPFLTYWKTQINASMTSLGGGYQLTEYSLASYFKY